MGYIDCFTGQAAQKGSSGRLKQFDVLKVDKVLALKDCYRAEIFE